MQKRRITIQHISVMHIFTRMSWNIQWNLHLYAISNLQLTTSHMSNVVDNRGTTRFITKPRMDICKINSSNHRTIESIINSQHFFVLMHRLIERHPPYLKTGEVHKRRPARSAYAGEASPVKWSNRPGHQRSSGATGVRRIGKWSCTPESFVTLWIIILQDIQGLIQKFY